MRNIFSSKRIDDRHPSFAYAGCGKAEASWVDLADGGLMSENGDICVKAIVSTLQPRQSRPIGRLVGRGLCRRIANC